MSFILWLVILVIGVPVTVRLLFEFNLTAAQEGRKSKAWGWISLFIAIILMIMAVVDYSRGIFVSMKHFALLSVKFSVGISLLLLSMGAFVGIYKRSKWRERIYGVLQGELGKKLKTCLPSNSVQYWVYGNRIEFLENGNTKVIYFRSLGYDKVPPIYTDIVCGWITTNVLTNYASYGIKRIYIEHEEYIGGGSDDYVKIEKDYYGYKATQVKGSDGHTMKIEETIGYSLYHSSLYSVQKLNKW